MENQTNYGNKLIQRNLGKNQGKSDNHGKLDKPGDVGQTRGNKTNQGNPEEKAGEPRKIESLGKPVKSRETWGKQEKSLN